MKKLIITTAVMLMAALVSSQAKAELISLTAGNGTSFNYDTTGATADSLNLGSLIPDNGLSDFAIFLGYVGDNPANTIAPFQLTDGVDITAPGTDPNRATVQFFNELDNGVDLTTTATFRLSEVSPLAPNADGLGASLLYDLSIEADNVTGANEGTIQSLVGFDFAEVPTADRQQAAETVPGFGGFPGTIAVGETNLAADRVLTGDFNFNLADDGTGRQLISNNNSPPGDLFNGDIADNLDRFGGNAPDFIIPSAINGQDANFSIFASQQTSEGVFNNAGTVLFRSTVAANAVAGVPEPSTLLMASMGLGMVAFRRRRKQKA